MQLFRSLSKALIYWQTTILLSVVYYVLVVPMGALYRMFSRGLPTGWQVWRYRADSLNGLHQQF